jgi:FAD/FMN-containing dehydrogenase
MAIDLVPSTDSRFASLNKGQNNGRFPTPEGSAAAIALCQTSDDVAQALEAAVKAGKRPTVRAGGHCYEDFVYNNPGGTIIDVRNMSGVSQDPVTKCWKIEAATTIGQTLSDLYKQGNVTITSAS